MPVGKFVEYGLLTMAKPFSVKVLASFNYLPAFFFCIFRDLHTVSVNKQGKKKRTKSMSLTAILTEQAGSIKDFFYIELV